MKRGNQRKFGRTRKVRTALKKSLSTALIDHGRIKTTAAKAKTLASTLDQLVTLARRGTLNSRRELLSQIGEKAAKKLVDEISKAASGRKGGYTRITRLGQRRSDGAEMAVIELVERVPMPQAPLESK
ncbi:MAG: 50S ribosomal protein L17 [Candidatus Yanofskybacteria bacterium GW2011_GWA1_48_10]|uniref:50S ribosomal protein L17 n=2 Tax=Candidatus Yanofskyibacteriota TaxID=1752733 RepID=A0A0G1X720_9BACT|nr:MAG: 50S ribosomal protein L17 [Candidatus Yanofskybacteria bacterium GW2011_GWA1_48_10]OGN06609.1 MAG: 50S ribosomal protein L17 [Candidatus Yanofskybacteria bacterium RIFCSPHIGHO2_01_FULL_48_25b]